MNEFVGSAPPFLILLGTKYLKTSFSQANPPGADPINVDVLCENLGSGEVFPTRKAVSGNAEELVTPPNVASFEKQAESYLEQNIPNPASQTMSIGFFVAKPYSNARIEIYSLATGKTLKQYGVQAGAKGVLEIGTSQLSSGMYGYRLLVEGKPVQWKKMVLIK